MTWTRRPNTNGGLNVPMQNLDELLRYQKAVVEEGLDTHVDYWLEFILALMMAYRWAGRRREADKLLQEAMRWAKYLQEKEAMEEL